MSADVKIFPQSIQSSAVQERAGLFIIHTTSFCLLRNICPLFNPQKSSKVEKTYGNLQKVTSKFIKLIMQNYGRALVRFASIRMIASGCYNNRVCLAVNCIPNFRKNKLTVSFRFLKTNRALSFLRVPITC